MKYKDEKNLIEKKIDGKIVYYEGFLELHKDKVLLPDGNSSTREFIHHPGAVAIIVIDGDDIYMEYQYRYPVGEVILEIPAGKLDKGEEIYSAALRELKEETGICAKELIKIGEMYNSVGYSDEVIHFFVAKDFTKEERFLDDEEFIDVVKMPFNKVLEMVNNNEIKDSKTAFGIMLYDNLLRNGKISK